MNRFVFSADGHVVEPRDLYMDAMPASLRGYGIRSAREGDHMISYAGDRVLHRVRINRAPSPEVASFGRGNLLGARDLTARLEDMAAEGVDAEIVFPTMGLHSFLIEHPEAELASVQIYNDWHDGFFGGHREIFVRCGLLPVRDFANTVMEMKRIAALGFTAAMLPSQMPAGVPHYNDEAWDPVFQAAQDLGIVFVLHTATGRPDVRPEKGPGGALINYTVQMCDAQIAVMYMIAGGILDRFPGVHVALIESGASWLAAVAERLDEVNHGHSMFVHPKLSLKPSEIIGRQVHASFQYDRACIMARSVTGTAALMWGSDYPHHEGTYPHSRAVLARLFDGIEIDEREKADIVGGNAARLFRLPRPEFATAA